MDRRVSSLLRRVRTGHGHVESRCELKTRVKVKAVDWRVPVSNEVRPRNQSTINATTVNRGVIQATPGTPVWEEIEDIFRNYYIDMRIIYMVLTWLWIWQFDCYQVGIISIVLQWLRHIGRSRNTISFRFLCLCLNLWAFLFSTPPPPPPPPPCFNTGHC